MAAAIIDGRRIAEEIRGELKESVRALKAQGVTPGLAVVLVGDDPASRSYVAGKEKACAEVGIHSFDNRLAASATQEELMGLVRKLNGDDRVHGSLVQLPLPRGLNEAEVLLAIDPDKDVDGFHPINAGRMMLGQKAFLPCTPHGVLQLLRRSGVRLAGLHVVVIGRSNIVGKPLANMLIQKSELANATVTVCHTGTRDLAGFTRQADVVVAAAGRPNTLTADMIREGAVVIDVGVNRVEDATKKSGFRLVGDVDFQRVSEKASMITPVPGGVGPMTIAMLLYNTVEAAKTRCRAMRGGEGAAP